VVDRPRPTSRGQFGSDSDPDPDPESDPDPDSDPDSDPDPDPDPDSDPDIPTPIPPCADSGSRRATRPTAPHLPGAPADTRLGRGPRAGA